MHATRQASTKLFQANSKITFRYFCMLKHLKNCLPFFSRLIRVRKSIQDISMCFREKARVKHQKRFETFINLMCLPVHTVAPTVSQSKRTCDGFSLIKNIVRPIKWKIRQIFTSEKHCSGVQLYNNGDYSERGSLTKQYVGFK